MNEVLQRTATEGSPKEHVLNSMAEVRSGRLWRTDSQKVVRSGHCLACGLVRKRAESYQKAIF